MNESTEYINAKYTTRNQSLIHQSDVKFATSLKANPRQPCLGFFQYRNLKSNSNTELFQRLKKKKKSVSNPDFFFSLRQFILGTKQEELD